MDYERAAFVQNEFRYATSEDLSVVANYANASEVMISSQLSSTDATSLAANMLNELKAPSLLFEVEVDAMIMSDDFATALPRYSATFPSFSIADKMTKVVTVETDFLNARSTMRVRTT